MSTFLIVVVSACLIYSVSGRAFGRLAGLAGAMIGGLTVLTHNAVVDWSPLMRVDMLAIALSLSGLLLCVWSLENQVWLFGAVLFFVAGVYTKQSEFVAPIAGIGPYLVLRPRHLILPALYGLGLAVVVLILLSWYTDGRFLQHIVVYNVNRFDVRRAYWAIRLLFYRNWAFLSVALAGAVIASILLVNGARTHKVNGIFAYFRSNRFAWLIVTLLIYLALSTATLVGLGKSGADRNYAIEWLCACNLFVGFALSAAIHSATSTKGVGAALLMPIGPVVIVALLMIHVSALTYRNETELRNAHRQKQLVELTRWIRAAPKPVLSDDMVLLMVAGKHVPLEPAIFAELSTMGRWDERQEIDLIKSRNFQFIITEGDRGDYYYDSRYTTAVADAIELAYPIEAAFAGYTIHLPKSNDCELGPPLRCPPDIAGH